MNKKRTLIARVRYLDQVLEAPITITPELPKLQGEMIFVNGFLSDPQYNSESVIDNAIFDKGSEDPERGVTRRKCQ